MRFQDLTAGLLFVVVVLGASGALLLAGTATVAGQTAAQNTTNQTGGQVITGRLTLLNKTYNAGEGGTNGTLSLTFRADGPVAVTLIDAGAFRQGGQLPTKTQVIEGTVTIEMPVTKQGAFVGVTVITGNTRYAVPHRVRPADSHLFSGRPTWQDTQIAGLSGFVGGLLVVSGVAYRRVTKEEGEVTRVL
jgi:hypothetical protein